jgi:SET domain-containing protein
MILLPESSWEIRDTSVKGKGVFAKNNIPRRKIIAQYTGKIVPFIDILLEKYNGYLMQYDDEHAIVPDLEKEGAHLVNHSCDPNCWVFPHEKNIFFVTIRDVEKDEELTIHYLYPPLEEGCEQCTHICECGSENCTGTMHTERKLYDWWQKFLT